MIEKIFGEFSYLVFSTCLRDTENLLLKAEGLLVPILQKGAFISFQAIPNFSYTHCIKYSLWVSSARVFQFIPLPHMFIFLFCLLMSVFKLCRSYGRAPKMIHLESNFVQFKEELLPKEGNKALLTFPFLHIYWTECCVSKKTSEEKLKCKS